MSRKKQTSKEVSIVRPSAAEYLTFVAATATAIDYDVTAQATKRFFATVQKWPGRPRVHPPSPPI